MGGKSPAERKIEMKLIKNMTLAELEAEKKMQLSRINKANVTLEKINGQKNYQDEVSKYFVGGMVGFRKDRKKVNQSINQYTDRAVAACECYDAIKEAESRIQAIDGVVNFIVENKKYGETKRQIKESKNKAAIQSTKPLEWEKVSGHYGTAYKHGYFIVERVDAGFVAVRDTKGNLLSHYKTVKEAKAAVSLALSKEIRRKERTP